MRRRHHYRRRTKEAPNLDITTFMNLMVVLVPFLLISAVFSRVTIQELSVPTASGGSQMVRPNFAIEVIVREAGLELGNGNSTVAAMPKKDGEYDLEQLSEMLQRLKAGYPDKTDATVLMEPDIDYDHLIRIMDTVRQTEITDETTGEIAKVSLFPDISIGDAP